ncbi:geranylgeranyl transferase type II beta [Cyclospora cayetanensis]|uniref:protein geranylgeranyltransferase type II n=1 Tax=Cyclospora cayetanensis TaxID=88456 RepID=A0A1D3DAC6_9EIME|nr:geranylgeranyl transferase type II beta [Cyclospora cayetanensis]
MASHASSEKQQSVHPVLPSWGPPDTSSESAKSSAATAEEAAELACLIKEVVASRLPAEGKLAANLPSLMKQLHGQYLLTLGADPFTLEGFFGASLKMGAAYWASTSLWLLGLRSSKTDRMLQEAGARRKKSSSSQGAKLAEELAGEASFCLPLEFSVVGEESCVGSDGGNAPSCGSFSLDSILETREDLLCDFVLRCLCPSGGFGQDIHQEAQLTATHYALLLLLGLGRLHLLPSPHRTAAWVRSLQTPDGGFKGDVWGEVDSRFSYCGVACLHLLGQLDEAVAARAVRFIQRLMNADGGFAWIPGGESHAASAFCCLSTLALCGGLWTVNRRKAAHWLIDRQTVGGGFNGRPEKAPDVCYSFWIYAAFRILGYEGWVDAEKLAGFILQAQDTESGGIADRPGDLADAFHTFFGLAALGMIYRTDHIQELHPVLALPRSVLQTLHIPDCLLC